jgi:hypothetical protein
MIRVRDSLRCIPPWSLIVAAWLAAYVTRPGMLGFYSDDWNVLLRPTVDNAAFSARRLGVLMEIYANRPVHGLLTFAFSSLCGHSPVLWHTAIAALALASAFAVYGFLRALLRLAGLESSLAAAIAAALWLVFPWMLGVTAWPSMAPGLCAVVFFVFAGRLFFDGWRRRKAPWLFPSLALLAGMLTYEAFYGQLFVLLLMGVVCGVARWVGRRRLALTLAACGLVQAAAIAWNRLSPQIFSVAATKSLYAQWDQKLRHSVLMLPRAFRYSAPELFPLPELVVLVLGVTCAGAIVAQLLAVQDRKRAVRQLALLALAACGGFIGLLIPALAGYSYKWTGHEARTLLSPSVWMSIAAAIALAAAIHDRTPVRVTAITGSIALGFLMTLATHARLREWAEVWAIQRRTVATAPVSQLRSAAPDSVILVTGLLRHKGLTVFAYPWDINGIMFFHYPDLLVQRLYFLPARDGALTTWDGHTVVQRKGDKLLWQRAADELWVWALDQRFAQRVGPPFEHPARPENAPRTDSGGSPTFAPNTSSLTSLLRGSGTSDVDRGMRISAPCPQWPASFALRYTLPICKVLF